MSFLDVSRSLPALDTGGLKDDTKKLAERIQDLLHALEVWHADSAQAINNNAGAAEVVDAYADLPPASEAAGRMYFLQVTPYLGSSFYISDGVAWVAVAVAAAAGMVVGNVNLATSPATTTDIAHGAIVSTTYVGLSPTNLFASAEVGAGNIYFSIPAPGTARIHHTSSAQARSFKYLLVSLLLSLVFFGKPVEAQQIQSNGTPLEVRPALNFQTALACTNDADSTNCDVDSNLVLFYSDQDLGADFLVDTVNGAPQIDSDNDTNPEIYCIDATDTCLFDVNEDGASDLAITGTGINYDGGYFLAATALGSGNGTTSTASVSACIMRDSTTSVDRLFEDKNCNSTTGTYTPEAGEGMLTDIIEKLTSTHTLASTTGTQVGGAAGFEIDLDGVATYEVIYNILSQSSSATVGLSYGVSFTGTSTLNCERRYVASAAGTIASGTVGPLAYEVWATATASTTAPNLGPNTGGVQTINTTALEIVRCLIDVTVAGDLQFWHSSETATNTSVMANSTVRAVRIN